ncbi:MAG: FAD binding domain-containing protein [Acidobacteriaceae bacterium]
MRNFAFDRAGSVEEAIRQHGATMASSYVAGGTTLIDLVKLNVMQPQTMVDVNRLGLDKIEALPGGGLKIGAMVRNSDLAWNETVKSRYTVLSEALLAGASAQLRNMATTGGNLMQRTRCTYFRDNISACNKREPGSGCAALEGVNRGHAILGTSESCIATHPSDMCVAMAALDATVLVQGQNGERKIPFAEFHLLPGSTPDKEHNLLPGELITYVTLPALAAETKSYYIKLRDRQSYEFALASAAVVVRAEGGRIREARVAFGGIGTKPWRSREAEAELHGKPANEKTFRMAAEAALKGAKPHKENAFKVELAKQALVRALQTVTA